MTAQSQKAIVHLPGAGRVIEMGSFQMTVKADGNSTDRAFVLLEAAEAIYAAATGGDVGSLALAEMAEMAQRFAMRVLGGVPEGYR